MNLHEYQGKELLNSFGVNIQRGIVATTVQEAVDAANRRMEHLSRLKVQKNCP